MARDLTGTEVPLAAAVTIAGTVVGIDGDLLRIAVPRDGPTLTVPSSAVALVRASFPPAINAPAERRARRPRHPAESEAAHAADAADAP